MVKAKAAISATKKAYLIALPCRLMLNECCCVGACTSVKPSSNKGNITDTRLVRLRNGKSWPKNTKRLVAVSHTNKAMVKSRINGINPA
ncbi:hypothetical protein D3C85_1709670 [compost metagenome]